MKKFAKCIFLYALVQSANLLAAPSAEPLKSTLPDSGNYLPRIPLQTSWEDYLQTKKGKPVDIIFIGDSITEQWRWGSGKPVWQKYYAERALDFGVGSDKTQHALWRLENLDIKGFHPKVAVVLIGTNNWEPIYTPEEVAAGVKAVVSKTQQLFSGVKVILVSILPNQRANDKMMAVNAITSQFADNRSVYYLDLASKFAPHNNVWQGYQNDHLHLNTQGYETWAAELNPLLTKLSAGAWN